MILHRIILQGNHNETIFRQYPMVNLGANTLALPQAGPYTGTDFRKLPPGEFETKAEGQCSNYNIILSFSRYFNPFYSQALLIVGKDTRKIRSIPIFTRVSFSLQNKWKQAGGATHIITNRISFRPRFPCCFPRFRFRASSVSKRNDSKQPYTHNHKEGIFHSTLPLQFLQFCLGIMSENRKGKKGTQDPQFLAGYHSVHNREQEAIPMLTSRATLCQHFPHPSIRLRSCVLLTPKCHPCDPQQRG